MSSSCYSSANWRHYSSEEILSIGSDRLQRCKLPHYRLWISIPRKGMGTFLQSSVCDYLHGWYYLSRRMAKMGRLQKWVSHCCSHLAERIHIDRSIGYRNPILILLMFIVCRTMFYGEDQCYGPGSNMSGRVPWSHNFTDANAAPFLTTSFIDGNTWLT